jgi:hypothetical protein
MLTLSDLLHIILYGIIGFSIPIILISSYYAAREQYNEYGATGLFIIIPWGYGNKILDPKPPTLRDVCRSIRDLF